MGQFRRLVSGRYTGVVRVCKAFFSHAWLIQPTYLDGALQSMLLFSLSIGSTTPYYNLVISKIKKIFGNVDDQVICIIADIIYRGEQLYKAQQSLYIISCIILSFLGWDWLLT